MSKKYSFPLFTLILCFLFLNSISQTVRTDCRLNGYLQTFGNNVGTKSHAITSWVYDTQGRLVTDSILYLDSLSNLKILTTVHYKYNNDSVIGIGNDGRRIVILLNSEGLPVYTNDPFNRIMYATYNDKGFLVSVSTMRDTLSIFLDNIVYRNGNIVSYHEVPYNSTKYFTYYKGKSGQSIYGDQKPFALRLTRIFVTYVDVQALSKNLLKSVRTKKPKYKSRHVSFHYKFDKNGRAVTMKRISNNSGLGETISDYKFISPCN